MSELPSAALAVSSSQLLAGIASALLVFVSGGVIYLSAVEWRDRRRRRAAETPGRSGSGTPAKTGKAGSSTGKAGGSRRQGSPTAFGRRL